MDVKILHTGDNHLGFRQYGLVLREGDFYTAFQQACMKAVGLQVDALLIAGDLFDAAKPPSIAVKVVQGLVAMLKAQGIRVLGIDGNHDVSGGNWLEVCGIEHIGGKVVTVFSKDGSQAVHVGGIDSCRPGVFFETLTKLGADGPVEIVCAHQAVAELSDFSKADFSAMQMAPAMGAIGTKYVALGDIHAYRETVFGNVRFAYSGSTEMNATDEPQDKSVSLVTWDGEAIHTAMIPLQTRPFILCPLNSESDVDKLLASVAACSVPPVVIGRYTAANRDLAKRAEAVLQSAGCMYRITPYVGETGKAFQPVTFERKQGMIQLKDAVEAYFEPTSDEFQLVFQLLDSPDAVKDTVTAYLKSKGL